MIARVQISKHLYTLPHVIVNIPTVIGNVEVFVWKTCEWKIFKTTRTNSEKIVVYLHGVPRKDSYSFPCLLHPTPNPLPTHTPNAQLYQNKTNHHLKPTDGFNKT